MEFAPPNRDKPDGALFGTDNRSKTLNGKVVTYGHGGIDLAGEVGDPIYAVSDGTIANAPFVDHQRNMITVDDQRQYPDDYTGTDKNAGGNRIYVNRGDGLQDSYMHLRELTPLAINPRTGNVFGKGDTVEAGDIIAYMGITGNANPNVVHLHYGVRRTNGTWLNPLDYLNATLGQKVNNEYPILTPCD